MDGLLFGECSCLCVVGVVWCDGCCLVEIDEAVSFMGVGCVGVVGVCWVVRGGFNRLFNHRLCRSEVPEAGGRTRKNLRSTLHYSRVRL